MNDNKTQVRVVIPASAEHIDLIRLTLYGIATKLGFSYETIEDMKVAAAEACNNAVLHAYGDNEEGEIEVRYVWDDESFRIVVKDNGRSFNFLEHEESREASLEGRPLQELQAGGLGIYLMQALMDDVQVSTASGTEVTLTKRLERNEVLT